VTVGLACGGAIGAATAAGAAEIRFHLPDECGEKRDVVDQAEALLGRPLASVPGVDFEVDIIQTASARWRMRLDTIGVARGSDPTTAARKTRELRAASCAELAEAAATAIALTVRSLEGDGEGDRDRKTRSAPSRSAPPLTVAPTRPSPAPPAIVSRVTSPPEHLRAALAVGAMGDAGSLPGVGAGLEMSGWVQLRGVRLATSGAVLAPREKRLSDGSGGNFQLAFGAIDVCAPRELGRSTFLLCGGFELGYLWATGIGVNRPRQGGAVWDAARAELGLSVSIGPSMAMVMRGGASVPLSRPDFALGGAIPVHRPSSVAGRAGVDVELAF
ncbi:MAG TPA: hypothetical protein VFH68_19725, partial [Polyangia bacterium]|jgi:hypothetical protein|nr:hypothetical protein [Polyangia bacterium]